MIAFAVIITILTGLLMADKSNKSKLEAELRALKREKRNLEDENKDLRERLDIFGAGGTNDMGEAVSFIREQNEEYREKVLLNSLRLLRDEEKAIWDAFVASLRTLEETADTIENKFRATQFVTGLLNAVGAPEVKDEQV